MEIRKVKYDGEELTVVWESETGDGTTKIDHTLTSKERPSPEFVDAMKAVVKPAARLLELDQHHEEKTTFRGASISFDSQGRRGMTVTLLRAIEGANAPVVENTPYLPEPDPDDPGPCLPALLQSAVDVVCDFAWRFTKGGEREQGDMFAEEVADTLEDRGVLAPA